MIKVGVDQKSSSQLSNIIKKIDTFPNRIQSAQMSAMARSANDIDKKIKQRHKAAKYLTYSIQPQGKLGVQLRISAPSTGQSEGYWAAVIFLNGRKNYAVHPKRYSSMKLRKESVQKGYPQFLKYAVIPSKQGNKSSLKQQSRDIIIKNLQYAVKRFGFGARGGVGAMKDLKAPRTRSAAR